MRSAVARVRGSIHRRGVRMGRALLSLMPTRLLNGWADGALRFRLTVQEAMRKRAARRAPLVEPRLVSCDGQEALTRSVLEPQAPWFRAPPVVCGIPGMLTPAERQYYPYVSRFYSGAGEVVELGPWLGLSTFCLLRGLCANPFFGGRKLHVFDDFTWRSAWMARSYPPPV